MAGKTGDIVARLWRLCDVLRDDGITYQDYVTELTFLLFLKMMAETGGESRIPEAYRWAELERREGQDLLDHYRHSLLELGKQVGQVGQIYADAQTKLRKPANLRTLVAAIDALDWFEAREEGLGDLYEGLLQKNANEKKSGAGQYFTPRPLIDCMVRLVKPQPGEVIQDPALGTAGFLVAAHAYVSTATDEFYKLSAEEAYFQRHSALVGMELVPDTHRLAMMNLMLHGYEGGAISGDALSPDGEAMGKANVILANPPFGTKKGGGRPNRADFSVTAGTSNKQLAFVEHIVRALEPGGRAAVVVPDNVLFEDGVGRALRRWMMELCNVHTILRLPTGIFYAQGVKTNVLFFSRGTIDRGNTKDVWVYDLRAKMPAFGKTRPLLRGDFSNFEAAYGEDAFGRSARTDEGETGRFRRFTREYIAQRGDTLDLSWLRDVSDVEDELTDPKDIAVAIIKHLSTALTEIKAVRDSLANETTSLTEAAE